MAAHDNHVKGRAIIVDHKRAGTLEQFVAKDRPTKSGPRIERTTWECVNCGNFLESKRGISRCPRCGSLEVVKLTALEPLRQDTPPLRETLPDDDDV